MNENLKKQEQEFKAHCKEEMARLKANIEKLKSETDSEMSEDQVSFIYLNLLMKAHIVNIFKNKFKVIRVHAPVIVH